MRIIFIGTKQGNFGECTIPNTLEDLQRAVNGYIEITTLPELKEHGIQMIVNEEGLLRGLKPNENLFPFFFVGSVLLVNIDGEDFASLTDKQVKFAMKWLTGLPL